MAIDLEYGVVQGILKWTLVLWLMPYILWFFGRRIYARVYHWVTEPAPTDNGRE